jgi:hypothetical protein
LELVPDWEAFIGQPDDETFNELLRGHSITAGHSVRTPSSNPWSASSPGP